MPPSPPTQPRVAAVSDTELALSWQQGESEGSAPVLHFLVAYIRYEHNTRLALLSSPALVAHKGGQPAWSGAAYGLSR